MVRTRQAAREARKEAERKKQMELRAQELAKESLDLVTKLQAQEVAEEEDDLESPTKLKARELIEEDPESVMKLQERHERSYKAPVEVEDRPQHDKSPRNFAEEMASIVDMLAQFGLQDEANLAPPEPGTDIFDVVLRIDSNFGETLGYRGESIVVKMSPDFTLHHAIFDVYFVYGVHKCIFSYENDLDNKGRVIGISTLDLIYMDEEKVGRVAKSPPKMDFPEIRDINGDAFLHVSMTEMDNINHVLCAFHVDVWAKKRGYCYETGSFHLPALLTEEELEALRAIKLERKNYYDAEEMFGDDTDVAEEITELENHTVNDEEQENIMIEDEDEESIPIVEVG